MQSLSKSEIIEFLNLIVEKSNLVMKRNRSWGNSLEIR